MVTPTAMRMNMILSARCLATKMAQQTRLAQSVEIAMIFTFRGIALSSIKSLM